MSYYEKRMQEIPLYFILEKYETNNEFWKDEERELNFLTNIYMGRFTGVIIVANMPSKKSDETKVIVVDGNKRINTIKKHLHLWRFNIVKKEFTKDPESETCIPLKNALDRIELNRWIRKYRCPEGHVKILECLRDRIRDKLFGIYELTLEFSIEHPDEFYFSDQERKEKYFKKYRKIRYEQIMKFIKKVRKDIHDIEINC